MFFIWKMLFFMEKAQICYERKKALKHCLRNISFQLKNSQYYKKHHIMLSRGFECSLCFIPITHTETELHRKRTNNVWHWIYPQESSYTSTTSFSTHLVILYRYFRKSYALRCGRFHKDHNREWKLANNFILAPKQEYIDFLYFFQGKTPLYQSWGTIWILTKLCTCFLFPVPCSFSLWNLKVLKDRMRHLENSSL